MLRFPCCTTQRENRGKQVVKAKEHTPAHKELQEAFNVFNGVADQLTETYRALENRITSLNQELDEVESERLQELAEKERLSSRLSQLLSALPAGVVVIDNRGVIQECNPAAIELLNKPLEGQLWREIILREFVADSQSGQEAVLKNGRVVSISTCPLGNEPGQIILLTDVTEARMLQSALERHKRLSAMGEMSAKVAHQIRTPLASALLYTSNLAKRSLPEPDRQRFAEKALNRMKHLEKVVNDMLAFTRDSTQSMAPVSLDELLHDLEQGMETHVDESGTTLSVENQDVSALLYANRDALVSVLQNLVTNAMQACQQNAKIDVFTRDVDQHQGLPAVDIVIKDNGPGISPENQKRIFEPFFSTKTQGTGLGLAVAQAVVQNHGGGLWIESSTSSGTTFVMRLPMMPVAPQSLETKE